LGQKIHPNGFRVGITRDWHATWFAGQKEYGSLVKEDINIRQAIAVMYEDAGISKVDIERDSNEVAVTIHTARPGIVIGRGGQRVDELRKHLETLTGNRRAKLNVKEVRQAELDAYLVARNVADQLERRIAFRRAIRQAVMRTMQAGAEGIKITCSGRLAGADIARAEKAMEGRVPLHTLRADIDYGLAEAQTEYGVIGVKVWICRGEILNPTIIGENSTGADELVASAEDEETDVAPIQVMVTAQEDNQVQAETLTEQRELVDEETSDNIESEGADADAST
jgi:small subunit ribosomal protein S3